MAKPPDNPGSGKPDDPGHQGDDHRPPGVPPGPPPGKGPPGPVPPPQPPPRKVG